MFNLVAPLFHHPLPHNMRLACFFVSIIFFYALTVFTVYPEASHIDTVIQWKGKLFPIWTAVFSGTTLLFCILQYRETRDYLDSFWKTISAITGIVTFLLFFLRAMIEIFSTMKETTLWMSISGAIGFSFFLIVNLTNWFGRKTVKAAFCQILINIFVCTTWSRGFVEADGLKKIIPAFGVFIPIIMASTTFCRVILPSLRGAR